MVKKKTLLYLANGYSLLGSSLTHRQCENMAVSVRAGFLNATQCHFRTPRRSFAFGCLYNFGSSVGMRGGWPLESSLFINPHTSRLTPCGLFACSTKRRLFFYSLRVLIKHYFTIIWLNFTFLCLLPPCFSACISRISRTSLIFLLLIISKFKIDSNDYRGT